MSVSEDAVVKRFLQHPFLAIEDDTFIVVTLVTKDFWTFTHTGAAILLTPAGGDAEGHPFGQYGEKTLVAAVAKYPSEDVVGAVKVPQAIAMPDEETLAVVFYHFGVLVHDNVHLVLEVIEHPHVMVAHKIMQFNTCVSHLSHAPEETDVSFGNDIAIGKPEVEHVAKKEYFGGVWRDAVKQSAEFFLPFFGVMTYAEVCVGDEIKIGTIGHIGSVGVQLRS